MGITEGIMDGGEWQSKVGFLTLKLQFWGLQFCNSGQGMIMEISSRSRGQGYAHYRRGSERTENSGRIISVDSDFRRLSQ